LNGGYLWFFCIIVSSFAAYCGLYTASSIFIEQWGDSSGSNSVSLYLYVGLALSSMVFLFIQTYSLVISSVQQREKMHSSILKQLLYSSYTNFFNRVPMGRILNRLGKDIQQLDEVIGLSLSTCLLSFVKFVSGVIIMIYASSAYVIIPVAVICFIFYLLRRYFVGCFHQVIRMEKVTNSPVVTGFTTAVGGLTTVRAYRKEEYFMEMQAKCLDDNNKAVFNKYGLESWYMIAMSCLMFILNTVCIGIAMFSKSSTSSSFGLLLVSMILAN
jgi:ABC-type multidrug transport system fused ATPase/permease subunit